MSYMLVTYHDVAAGDAGEVRACWKLCHTCHTYTRDQEWCSVAMCCARGDSDVLVHAWLWRAGHRSHICFSYDAAKNTHKCALRKPYITLLNCNSEKLFICKLLQSHYMSLTGEGIMMILMRVTISIITLFSFNYIKWLIFYKFHINEGLIRVSILPMSDAVYAMMIMTKDNKTFFGSTIKWSSYCWRRLKLAEQMWQWNLVALWWSAMCKLKVSVPLMNAPHFWQTSCWGEDNWLYPLFAK